MLFDRKNLAVAKCAARDNGRYSMRCVQFGKDGTAATDGRVLAFVSYPDAYASEYPAIANVEAGKPASDLKPFIVDAKAIVKACGKAPKSYKRILECVALDVDATNENESVAFGYTDLETAQAPLIRKAEGDFPTWRSIVPNRDTLKGQAFAVNVLERALAAMKAAGCQNVRLLLNSVATGPAMLTSVDGREAFVVFMPIAVER